MTSCILTIIKNEHQYLDEWIKYHLNLGVSHIFIFEDIDSLSHKEITDKYSSFVTLNPISNLLKEHEIKLVNKLKETKATNPQFIYLEKAIWYIKNNFNYNWCFVIDVDEFITLENTTDKLINLLDIYKEYDAVLLQWECYGANGLINKPDYSEKGVLDIYTKPTTGYVPGKYPDSFSKKIIYNLNNYKRSFWNGVHQPADICNFCNTDLKRDRKYHCFKNIYIRHYVTKSWEEYVWKKKSRGYFMGFRRTFDAFFKINPELQFKEEELLSQIDDEVLVVLPYVRSGRQGNELRLALSAWRKFCKSKYHFVLIGDIEPDIQRDFNWVEFIPVPKVSKKADQYTPHLDIQHKMEIAYNLYKDKYPGFIWMVDDNYAIKPFYTYELKAIYMHSNSFSGEKNAPIFFWNHNKWKTKQLLVKEHLPGVNYTTHFPCYFDFTKLKDLWDKYNLREESYVVEDIYFNSYNHEIVAPASAVRLGIWNKQIFETEFEKAINNPEIKFVCNSVEGWSKELEEALWKIIV